MPRSYNQVDTLKKIATPWVELEPNTPLLCIGVYRVIILLLELKFGASFNPSRVSHTCHVQCHKPYQEPYCVKGCGQVHKFAQI